MSAKSATMRRIKFVPVPKNLRPTKESIAKMGKEITMLIRQNDCVRPK